MSNAVDMKLPRSRRTSTGARLLLCWLAISLAAPAYVPAQVPGAPPALPNPGQTGAEKLILLNFRDAPLDQVLEFTADLLGRTLIKSPGLNATITLKSQTGSPFRKPCRPLTPCWP
jgi:hypothetical protein